MKTVYLTTSSLDGFIADAQNSLEWLLQFQADPPGWEEFEARIGAIAMGATTYQWLLQHELMQPGADPKPWPYRQPTWIFTHRTWPTPLGADIHFVQGDVRPVHKKRPPQPTAATSGSSAAANSSASSGTIAYSTNSSSPSPP